MISIMLFRPTNGGEVSWFFFWFWFWIYLLFILLFGSCVSERTVYIDGKKENGIAQKADIAMMNRILIFLI
jgi:hypothetical protein